MSSANQVRDRYGNYDYIRHENPSPSIIVLYVVFYSNFFCDINHIINAFLMTVNNCLQYMMILQFISLFPNFPVNFMHTLV